MDYSNNTLKKFFLLLEFLVLILIVVGIPVFRKKLMSLVDKNYEKLVK